MHNGIWYGEKANENTDIFFTSVINLLALGHKSIFCILFVYLKILGQRATEREYNKKARAIICNLIDVTIL